MAPREAPTASSAEVLAFRTLIVECPLEDLGVESDDWHIC
jgi:hypothetical protein